MSFVLPTWPPRDWRMLVALCFLAVAGAGAWLLAMWSLSELVTLAAATRQVWPVAYYAYGALGLLGLATSGFAMVVALKSFRVDLPGGAGFGANGDSGSDAAPVPFTATATITTGEPK